jgi:hypothetical protein
VVDIASTRAEGVGCQLQLLSAMQVLQGV